MDLKKFKLGVGPMSNEIIDLSVEYSKKFPLMIIASRNQVDYNSGYVCTTKELVDKIKSHPDYSKERILICRDHCGPYFKDSDKELSLAKAMDQCFKTLMEDIDSGFDLIHIDVSRIIEEKQIVCAKMLFEFAIHKNPSIMIEFGSEDNTGEKLEDSVKRLGTQIEFASRYFPNSKYIVSQTGSLTKHQQVGNFNIEFNSKISKLIHDGNLFFKEHNADYLSKEEVNLRKVAGVDALNIAPQLGTAQTNILRELSRNNSEWQNFAKKVLESNIWKRWLPNDIDNSYLAVYVSGHYFFSSEEYKNLISTINYEEYKSKIKQTIFNIFDTYLE